MGELVNPVVQEELAHWLGELSWNLERKADWRPPWWGAVDPYYFASQCPSLVCRPDAR